MDIEGIEILTRKEMAGILSASDPLYAWIG